MSGNDEQVELGRHWVRLMDEGGYLPDKYHCPACGKHGGLGISWRPYEVSFLCAFCGWHGRTPTVKATPERDGGVAAHLADEAADDERGGNLAPVDIKHGVCDVCGLIDTELYCPDCGEWVCEACWCQHDVDDAAEIAAADEDFPDDDEAPDDIDELLGLAMAVANGWPRKSAPDYVRETYIEALKAHAHDLVRKHRVRVSLLRERNAAEQGIEWPRKRKTAAE